MEISSINISALAYCKIVLHAIKYPHCSVRGVLLGRYQSDNVIDIHDSIPALHTALLAPPIEILLIHLDAYCQEKQLHIVGLYFGNQLLTNNALDEPWLRVALEKITKPIILQIDNSKLSLNAVVPCLRAYGSESLTKWQELEYFLENTDDTVTLTSLAVQNKLHRGLSDFENHLDDPLIADFYNSLLNYKILSINNIL